MSFLYIWDFCKFLFESNATQTTKIQLIKYTVVIYLASRLFISFSSRNLIGGTAQDRAAVCRVARIHCN